MSYEFLEAVQESLSGLEKVTLNFKAFQDAIAKAVFLLFC
jgi:hypothetical protein